jgi:guanylate kinase
MGNQKGKIIILSGPSGVGKGSVNRELEKDKSLHLKYSVSMTTRASRPGEVEGVNYFFVDRDTFEDAIQHGELIEYAEFIGNYYGTPRNFINEEVAKGKNVILEIEIKGATQVLQREDPESLVSIFLMPPSLAKLEERLRKRGTEGDDVIKQRLDKALIEIPLKHRYKYIIENDSVENAVAKIKDVLLKEGTLDISSSESYYEKTRAKVEAIILDRYKFIINNWRQNVEEMGGEQEIPDNFDFTKHLVNLLTDRIYGHVLQNEDIKVLDDADFVKSILEHFMLDVNFFSIEQKNFENA